MRTLLSWAKSMKWTSAGPPAVSAGIDSGSAPTQARSAGQVGSGDVVASGAHARTLSWAALAELGASLPARSAAPGAARLCRVAALFDR